jgi:hypothetical protein
MQMGKMGPPPGRNAETGIAVEFIIRGKKYGEERFKKLKDKEDM